VNKSLVALCGILCVGVRAFSDGLFRGKQIFGVEEDGKLSEGKRLKILS
jgi:hypothetical protein